MNRVRLEVLPDTRLPCKHPTAPFAQTIWLVQGLEPLQIETSRSGSYGNGPIYTSPHARERPPASCCGPGLRERERP